MTELIELIIGISVLGLLLFYTRYWAIRTVSLIERYHRQSHLKEYVSNYKFIQAGALNSEFKETDYATAYDSIVGLDNNRIKNIIFANHINFIYMEAETDRLMFNLYNPDLNTDRLEFTTKDYKIKSKTIDVSLSTNVMFANFPKNHEELNLNKYNLFNLKDVGYENDFFIREDHLIAINFDNNTKDMYVFIKNLEFPVMRIPYRTKTEMLKKLKESKLKNHIYQWGIGGYTDSTINFIQLKEEV